MYKLIRRINIILVYLTIIYQIYRGIYYSLKLYYSQFAKMWMAAVLDSQQNSSA